MSKKRDKPLTDVKPVDALSQINPNAAGLDIGAEEIYVCVPAERDAQFVRAFGTFTRDLYALAEWLTDCRIETVAMESTGVYWIPIYEILESRGFEVCLGSVNKQLPVLIKRDKHLREERWCSSTVDTHRELER